MTTPVLAHELVQQRDTIPVDDVIDGSILDVHPTAESPFGALRVMRRKLNAGYCGLRICGLRIAK